MRSRLLVLILCIWTIGLTRALALAAPAAPADEAGTDTVEIDASGVGTTADAAQKDALTSAVREAVGLYVDAETLVKNEDVIYDRVLSVSNGFVERFEVTAKARKRRADGLFEVKIRAVVRKGQVVERLREAKVVPAKVDVQNVWGEAVTRIENAAEARKLLAQRLPGLAGRLLRARLVDEEGKPLAGGSVPAASTDTRGGMVTCAWNVEVTWDRAAYFEEVAPILRTCFDAVSVRSSGEYSRTTRTALPERRGQEPNPTWKRHVAVINKPIRWVDTTNRGSVVEVNRREEFELVLNVASDRSGEGQRYVAYALPRDDYLDLMKSALLRTGVRVTLLGGDGQTINERVTPLDHTLLELGTLMPRNRRSQHRNPLVAEPEGVAPTALIWAQQGPGVVFGIAPEWRLSGQVHAAAGGSYAYGYARTDALLIRHEVELSPDDLKDLKEVRLSFVGAKAQGR